MELLSKKLKDLFPTDNSNYYTIPDYQRAFSWKEKNFEVLLEDLRESSYSSSPYFYGNIILEISSDKVYKIIDGQQRLTTALLFARAAYNINGDEEIRNRFLSDNLDVISYDNDFYNQLVNLNEKTDPETQSQKKYLLGINYFTEELRLMNQSDIATLMTTLFDSDINVLLLDSDIEAAKMFELQNNRGEPLTQMERFKSFVLYQLYLEEDSTRLIKKVTQYFEECYRKLPYILSISEDSVLTYATQSFFNRFDKVSLKDLENYIKKASNKIDFIEKFTNSLKVSFQRLASFSRDSEIRATNIRRLGVPAWSYPFIIKVYGLAEEERSGYLRTLETLIFRKRLTNRQNDMTTQLRGILKKFDTYATADQFNHDVVWEFNDSGKGVWYLSDSQVRSALRQAYRGSKEATRYLLEEYEVAITRKGYEFRVESEKRSLEHISPQNPKKGNSNGYVDFIGGNYSKEFIENELNNIGNIILVTGSDNSKFSNKDVLNKVKLYESVPLEQVRKVIQTIKSTEYQWGTQQIEERLGEITDFVLTRWPLKY
jgi:hypothetical protein